ncbi:MAG: anaerobic carbon-monoxide dehydrogenase catalytic subunit [Lachnospiraceae bacterium]|nr:anaerobic carbon-monoxide dehydrogenase catalytic subunit [Lachnospiraceae bacterium]MBQ4309268.1 anaerobic carbon-monoxide dehydrogenase catalytic subunit [Lachnospiraceae bacterium]MBR2738238.1 anaerobic carbon-monoxide dehydrogenase catalytic subunit [Lachnospiraceae bacterium]
MKKGDRRILFVSSEFVTTTVEQMEADTERLHQTAELVGIDTWQDRVKNQTPHCMFGEQGVCCKICSMGPCRITPRAPKGICGATADTIAGRNYLRMAAAGAATHSDHGRECVWKLADSSADGYYHVTDATKLLKLAAEWGVETEGRDIYDVAHEVAEIGLNEYGKIRGYQRFTERATEERLQKWEAANIRPRAVDREVVTSMHMTHMGNTADAKELVRQALRVGMSDGWGGSMAGTEMSDILYGTPMPKETEGNLGVLDKEMVNIVCHGHDPAVSEMIVQVAESREMQAFAREQGAKGINIVGLCCTANEIAMRHGIKMAGNFLQQENAILTGVVEAIVVDVQCIFPNIGPVSECFHTKFYTTSPIARIPYSTYLELTSFNAGEVATQIVREACENFKNRDEAKIYIPEHKHKAAVGYSCEGIKSRLDTVTNSHLDEIDTYKPLIDCVKSGVLRGAVAMVGCNNPKIRPDYAHIELMKKLIANDIIVVATGCAAQAASKAGLLDKRAKELCGEGLRRVCTLADIPPVLHMGSCVDISRMMLLVTGIAKDWGIDTYQLPVVGCAPEWMSEKAVSIANYVVSTGITTFLGVEPQVSGSKQMMELITDGVREWVDAGYVINTNPDELVDQMIECIEEKRKALDI